MPEPTVGKIFEVGINGVGYMLAEDGQDRYRRVTQRIEPQRFASGETPVSETFERYSFFNSSEWRNGAGQRFLNRGDSDQSGYWDSRGVDPFTEDGRLQLLPDVDLKVSLTETELLAVGGGQHLLVKLDGDFGQFTIAGDTPTTGSAFTPQACQDADFGRGRGFIASGTDLRQWTLSAGSTTQLSTLDVHRVRWIGDRLAVLYRDSATDTWRFSTLDDDGTEEVPNGLLTLPGATDASMASCEYQLGGMAHGINYVWFSSWTADGEEAVIHVWNIDTTLSPYVAMQMPRGEIPIDIFFYQGALYIWAAEKNGGIVKVYRCIVNGDGTLTPFLTVSNAGTAPSALLYDGRKFDASGERVFFAWNDMESSIGGFGQIFLPTGGYAKRGVATLSGEVKSVFVWGNRPGMTVAGRGIYLEHSSDKRTGGWLRTSFADADSAIDKRWSDIRWDVDYEGLTNISLAYSIDEGDTYTSVLSSENSDTKGVVDVGVDSPHLGMQISLNGAGNTPYVRVVSAKFHPLGLIDELLILPINCADKVEGLNGADLGYTINSGRARARTLTDLLGHYVEFQDVDWAETDTVGSYEVMQVDVRPLAGTGFAQDESTRSNRSALVAVVTLRKDNDLATLVTPSANNAPVVSNPGAQSDTVDVAISAVQLSATDADSDPLTWGAKGLPTGLVCDLNGRITGTPTETGVFSVTVYASDQVSTGNASFSWTIS